MPRQNRVVEGLIPGSCKIRKRGCSSSSSSSSVLQNYQFKRAILVGKPPGSRSSTSVPSWRTTVAALDSRKYAPSQSGGGRSRPVSARKLAAMLWEMNEVPSPRVGDNLEEKKAIKREMRVRERMEVPRSVHSGSLPPHLSDPSHSPVSEGSSNWKCLMLHSLETLTWWERLGDIIMLPMTSFKDPAWDSVGAELWPIVAKSLGAQRLARQGRVAPTGTRDSSLEILVGDNGWVDHWENGILYSFDSTKCMFSWGNLSEKLRMARLDCRDEVIVVLDSVLVTIDRHEWYAPPQIYTRNDSTGLWKIKPALPPESPFLSLGMNKAEKALAKHTAPLDADGSPSIETSSEYVAVGLHSHDDSDVGTKKRQVEEDSSADSIVIANCSLHEPREEKLEDSTNSENAFLEDCQGVSVTTANASVAECVIEPTLVMFEVHVPPSCMVDGVRSQHFLGTGVIIYHSHNMGLVAVDKNTVVISVSDVMLSFAAFPIEIPGELFFLISLSWRHLIWVSDFGSTFSGVLTDEHGRVQALWGSFSTQLKYRSSSSEDHQFARGIPIYTISQVLDKIISGANGPKLLINGVRRPMPLVRILEVELYPTLLSKARSFGLSDKWIQVHSLI
ncbi:protease Do-like 7 [Camellia sinensis]|uniref:protease Do-like 7 n=1 Tax=Camellia sinensis TaxID=4442 RepID=UPI00103620D1|nr:protease Do-like 7 [Camellia sinensis]